MSAPRLFTIGFTRTSAEHFFGRLQAAGVREVLDVRLNNVSQLAGFAKKTDLEWFLRRIASIGYRHAPELAPTSELLAVLRSEEIDWTRYEERFRKLMVERRIEDRWTPAQIDRTCLLCAEPGAEQCHRRLVAEHLQRRFTDLEVRHL